MEDIADDMRDLRPQPIDLPDLVATSATPADGTPADPSSPAPGSGGSNQQLIEMVNALKAEINRMAAVEFRLRKTENEYPDW